MRVAEPGALYAEGWGRPGSSGVPGLSLPGTVPSPPAPHLPPARTGLPGWPLGTPLRSPPTLGPPAQPLQANSVLPRPAPRVPATTGSAWTPRGAPAFRPRRREPLALLPRAPREGSEGTSVRLQPDCHGPPTTAVAWNARATAGPHCVPALGSGHQRRRPPRDGSEQG